MPAGCRNERTEYRPLLVQTLTAILDLVAYVHLGNFTSELITLAVQVTNSLTLGNQHHIWINSLVGANLLTELSHQFLSIAIQQFDLRQIDSSDTGVL